MKKSVKRVLWASALIVVAVAAVLGATHLKDQQEANADAPETPAARRIPVVLTPATRMLFKDELVLAGNVHAKTFAVVSARVPGVLDKVLVDEGDVVVADTTRLLQTDAVNLTTAVAVARDQLTVAACSVRERQTNLTQVRADFDLARIDYERYKRLYEQDGAVPKSAYESQRARFLGLQAAVKHAEVSVELAKARELQDRGQLAIAQKNLRDSVVLAPIGGVVTARHKEPGEMAAMGAPVLRIEDPDVVEVSCQTPAKHYNAIEAGKTEAAVTVNGVTLRGTVAYVSPTIDPRFRTFEVRCDFQHPPAGVVTGAMATLRIVLTQRKAVGVPIEAVLDRRDGPTVFLVDGDKATARTVTTGLRTDGQIEVISDAITPGRPIVTMGQFLLDEGTDVLVRKER